MVIAPLLALVLMSPAAPDALSEARELYDTGGSLEEITTILERALDSGGVDEREARLLLAQVQIDDVRAENAVETLLALDLDGDYEGSVLLGDAYLAWAAEMEARGHSADDVQFTVMDASSHYERAVGLASGDTRAAVSLGGIKLYTFGESQEVLELADGLLQSNPDNGELLMLRGDAESFVFFDLWQQGDQAGADAMWQKAVDDVKAANERLPRERLDPLMRLVWLYESKGRAMDAVQSAGQIVDRQEEPNFDTLYRLALTYAENGPFDAAGRAIEKMVSVNARDLTNRLRRSPDRTATAILLARGAHPYVQRGDRNTARTILGALASADPEDAAIWNNYGVLCQDTSRFEDALKAFERQAEIDPSDPRPYNDIATVLSVNLGREQDRAVELYKKCIAMADTELAQTDLDPARRAHVASARQVAQDNLNRIQPQQSSSLLDSMLEGLRKLDLPEDGADGEPTADGGESTSGTSGQ